MRVDWFVGLIAASIAGIAIGFIIGLEYTINKVAENASRFVSIDPALLKECIERVGTFSFGGYVR